MSVERVAITLRRQHLVFHCYFDSEDMAKRGNSPLALIRQALMMLYNPSSVRRFKRQIEACRPDLILLHNVFPVGSIGIYRAAMNSGIPVLHYIHNFRPFSVNGYLWGDNRLIQDGLRKNFWPEIVAGSWQNSRARTAWYGGLILLMHWMGIYRRMTGWVAISQFMKDTFVAAGIPEERIFLLPHSWDLELVPESAAGSPNTVDLGDVGTRQEEAAGRMTAPRGPGILPGAFVQTSQSARPTVLGNTPAGPEAEPTILFLGRLTEAKGLRVLIEAWKQVEAERSVGRLIICGDGPMGGWLADQQSHLQRIDFPGFVTGDQKKELLRQCRAMVVPSVWWEPLGLVVYEAYQYCRPVIAARSGGLTETVLPGQTGWLYEAKDVEALKDCLIAALDDRAEAERRGQAGRAWVEQNTGSTAWLESFSAMAEATIRLHKASHGWSVSESGQLGSFSIVTPSFKQLDLLQRCAASVADQTGNFKVEHLIHDGLSGADFDSWAATQTFATCRSENDGGMYDAINRGFARATGDIVAWINCDEQYLPGTLSKVAEYFARHPQVDILFGDIVVVSPDGNPIGYRQAILPMPGHIRACFLSTFSAATFLRRKVIDQGHLLDIRYRAISDAVWIEELLCNGYRCGVLNEPLAVFTQTGSNLGQTPLSVEEGKQWRKITRAEGQMRKALWSTLHRFRKLLAGAYRSREVNISIYLNEDAGRQTRRGIVSERWVGKMLPESQKPNAKPKSSSESKVQHSKSKIAISAYLADQNPGHDRSFGISRMSQVVLEALHASGRVRIATIASRTSQQAPASVDSSRILPWGTRGKWVRLFTDHFHPLFVGNSCAADLHYFPKGYLPLLERWCRPSVVTIHDTIIQYDDDHYPHWRNSWEYVYWAKMLKHTLRRASRIMTVSESSKQQIQAFMDRHGLACKEIIVTYEPCLYECIAQPFAEAKENYVIHLASCEPHKRTAHLIRWWYEAEASGMVLPMLHLIGTVPPEVMPLLTSSRTIVKQPFLVEAALQAAYRDARALILPSEIEGFGLPALEAYFLGTPVCFVRGTSVEEILGVATSKGGFELENAAALFAALDEVMAMSPEEIYQCGLKLREAYAASKVAAKIVEVFLEAKMDSPPRRKGSQGSQR